MDVRNYNSSDAGILFYLFVRWKLYPRVLRDVSVMDLSTSVLGQKISMPICVGATAMQRMAHPDGEMATAKGKPCSIPAVLLSLNKQTNKKNGGKGAGGHLFLCLQMEKVDAQDIRTGGGFDLDPRLKAYTGFAQTSSTVVAV